MSRKVSRVDPWWADPEDNVHANVFALLATLKSYDAVRRKEILVGMALYGDRAAVKAISEVYDITPRGDVSYNLVRSCCDTAQAKIAAQNTLPRILTQRGDWSLRRKAKLCERMIEGDFDRNAVHHQASEGFLDALKSGMTGFKVYTQAGRTKVDLVRPGEVFVDPVDGKYRDPRCIYQISFLPRESVKGMIPADHKDREKLLREIDMAPRADGSRLFSWQEHDTTLDTIQVIEAWRTPDPEESSADDLGRHAICIATATLVDEEWDRGLPFVFYRYAPESTGFYGQSMAMNLLGIQREINYTYRKTQRCLELNSGFQAFVDGASNIDEDDLTDLPGQVVSYNGGNPPAIRSSNTVPSEFWHYIGELIQRGYEQEGLSQMGATSKKPAGLDSGAAIREANDIESARFVIKSKAYEAFVGIELPKKVIEEKRHQSEGDEEKPVRAQMPRGRGVKFLDIRWSDIALDPDDYEIKVSPSSELPRTSAGRQATLDGWVAGGFVGREQYLMLQNRPDLDEFLAMELAPYEIILDHLEDMVEDGIYTAPEPVQDIQLSLRLASNAYQRHVADGVPEDRAELILVYIEDLRAMMEQAQAAQQAAQPAPPEAPPGAPQAAPQPAPAMPS